MSGGSFEYMYERIFDTYFNRTEDKQIDLLIKDLCVLLKELEWYKSSDTSEEDYRKELLKFKEKWLNKSSKKIAIEEIKLKAIEEINKL